MKVFFDLVRRVAKKRAFRYGLPFIVFMIGGSFGLEQFSKLRYQYSRKSTLRPEDLEPFGIYMKKPGEVTLESEYEKVKKMDIDNWENIRGPRPWEEPILEK